MIDAERARAAALERELLVCEEQTAWCGAVRAPRDVVARLCGYLSETRALLASANGENVADALDRAESLLTTASASASAMLPRTGSRDSAPDVAPRFCDGAYHLENRYLSATMSPLGIFLSLANNGEPNCVALSNAIKAYRNRALLRGRVRVAVEPAAQTDDGLHIPMRFGRSAATMRISLRADEPFVRVELAVARSERAREQLFVEDWLTAAPARVDAGLARFTYAANRIVRVTGAGRGFAVFALDGDAWTNRSLPKGGTHLSRRLPSVEQTAWAVQPGDGGGVAELERAWERFALPPRVRLFVPHEPNVLVTRTFVGEDATAVNVTVRECNGAATLARVRCAARAREILHPQSDAAAEAHLEAEDAVIMLPALAERTFQVRFS